MLEILRERRWWGFTVFVLGMLVLCAVLSRWQWQRYQVRLEENDRLDAALSGQATPIEDLLIAQPRQIPHPPMEVPEFLL